jgi:hypothetical protein
MICTNLGRTRWLLATLCSVLPCLTCSGVPLSAGANGVSTNRQFIVVVDLSGSRSDTEIDADKGLIGSIVYDLRPNDKLVLLRVAGTGAHREVKAWNRTMPTVRDFRTMTTMEKRRIEAVRDDARRDANALFDARPSVKRTGTDIFSTLFTVRDHVLESGGRRSILVVLSDMIHEADGVNMAKNPPPDSTWINKRKANGLLPELDDLCVSIVGADMSTAQGASIRRFWETYFKAAGAKFDVIRYRRTATLVESVTCSTH